MTTRTHITRGRFVVAAAALGAVVLMVSGCSCVGADWDHAALTDPAGATLQDHPECRFDRLAKRSAAAAEITATADPALLAAARREAEQDCLRSQS